MLSKIFPALLLLAVCFISCEGQQRQRLQGHETDTVKMIERSEEEWRKVLTPQQYSILRLKGTDRPFTGKYYLTTDNGDYHCAACGAKLFTSDMKF